jgi:hypothetical protein
MKEFIKTGKTRTMIEIPESKPTIQEQISKRTIKVVGAWHLTRNNQLTS